MNLNELFRESVTFETAETSIITEGNSFLI